MKTNLKPQPLYGQTHIQHMTRLAVATLTVAILFGLMAGCDATDPVIGPPPSVVGPSDPSGTSTPSGTSRPSGPACSSSSASLVGSWEFIGFSNNGTELEVTGTWLFRANGELSIQAAISGRNTSGEFTYNQGGLGVMIADVPSFAYDLNVAGKYSLSFCGNDVTLINVNASRIFTLRSFH